MCSLLLGPCVSSPLHCITSPFVLAELFLAGSSSQVQPQLLDLPRRTETLKFTGLYCPWQGRSFGTNMYCIMGRKIKWVPNISSGRSLWRQAFGKICLCLGLSQRERMCWYTLACKSSFPPPKFSDFEATWAYFAMLSNHTWYKVFSNDSKVM